MGLRTIFFISMILLSLAVGVVDQKLFDGSVNLLNPAAALSTVVAFVALVVTDESSPAWQRELVEGSLASSVVLHVLHIFSLTLVGVNVLPFLIGYMETYRVREIITEPIRVSPFTIVAKVMSLDTVILLLLYYLFKFKKEYVRSIGVRLLKRK